MKELVKLNIIHRDLKLENILIHDGVIKITDFGFAKKLKSVVINLFKPLF